MTLKKELNKDFLSSFLNYFGLRMNESETEKSKKESEVYGVWESGTKLHHHCG